MGLQQAPKSKNNTAARETARSLLSVFGRGVATSRRVRARLSRPVSRDMPPVWTPRLTWIAFAAIYAMVVAAIFDPYFVPFAGPPHNFVLAFLRGITDVAKSGVYIVSAVIVVAIIGMLNWRDIRHATRRSLMTAYGQAAFILVSVAGPGILVNVIKQFVGRARPRIADEVGVYALAPFEFDHVYQGFPSGHAATAGSLAMILMLWHPRARWPAFGLLFLLACARIPAGAHYPSDVIAGFSFAAILTLVLARWLARRRAVFQFGDDSLFPVLKA
ncbi:phosphatase PAP2 family protein [Oricola indica]|jgi:membrane-associated phospholipid phosphatase|uniref:phosphatase PAP2 family protein n=1 Tax=Oricola indica TaxID=2872591 RepID=UPI001CBF9973|nr:phosphatase PAP2 family protein [Oricola indica]